MRKATTPAGKVYLIGAGPGAADLLTIRAARALARAHVVLVDALVDRDALLHCAPGARVIDVGKRAGCRSTPQLFIQRLMWRYARQGCVVARLKGGDAFVFGRGGEEIEFLRRHGIEVEVIPGLTAGIAVPASLGIPVTHRGIAHGVTFITGHAGDGVEPDWRALVQSRTTLVVYMGLQRLAHIAASLAAAGLSGATPVAVIARGTLPGSRQVCAPLAGIAAAVDAQSLESPALIVVGNVVALAHRHAAPAVSFDSPEVLPRMEATLP